MRIRVVISVLMVSLLMLCFMTEISMAEDTKVPAVRKPTFEPMNIGDYQATYPEVTGLDCGMTTFFDRFIDVHGVTVAAMPNTPVPDIIHAAKVYAQIMDSDEDFMPDDMKIYESVMTPCPRNIGGLNVSTVLPVATPTYQSEKHPSACPLFDFRYDAVDVGAAILNVVAIGGLGKINFRNGNSIVFITVHDVTPWINQQTFGRMGEGDVTLILVAAGA